MTAAEETTHTLTRRQTLTGLSALMMTGALSADPTPRAFHTEATMRITCFIRYQIDPFQKDVFAEYAENWSRIIPRCGGHLLGYFLPDEGTNDVAWGLIAFASLAAYEQYRTRLKADPEAKRNFERVNGKRVILREERTFLEIVANTFERPAASA